MSNLLLETADHHFVGRRSELSWLREAVVGREHSFSPIVIHGPGGVGKTALLREFAATSRLVQPPHWIDLYPHREPVEAIEAFVRDTLRTTTHERRPSIVILDGAEGLSDQEMRTAVGQIYNYKAVRSLIISTRRRPNIERAQELHLSALDRDAAMEMLRDSTTSPLTPEQLSRLADAASGYPLALKLLSGLIKTGNAAAIERLASGIIYELSDRSLTQPQLVVVAAPEIITASEALATRLKKQPHDVHSLSSREFEILLAELLRDMGWEVELTKATRDGGKDILAYLNTDVGRLLCLVEAKRYRRDNKIGVELVRSLYGTLCDYHANSAMMVTTSSFSADAKEFQNRHPFQLSLRDCADVIQWIGKYKSQ